MHAYMNNLNNMKQNSTQIMFFRGLCIFTNKGLF